MLTEADIDRVQSRLDAHVRAWTITGGAGEPELVTLCRSLLQEVVSYRAATAKREGAPTEIGRYYAWIAGDTYPSLVQFDGSCFWETGSAAPVPSRKIVAHAPIPQPPESP